MAQITAIRIAPVLAALAALLIGLATPALAQSFNPSGLSGTDRQEIQRLLEEEHTNVPHTLPASGDIFTITRTETQPRICRHFVVQTGDGAQRRGVGCRVSALNWELAADLSAITQAPAISTEGSTGSAPQLTEAPSSEVRPAPEGPNPGLSGGPSSASADVPITPFLEIEPRPVPIRRGGEILPFAMVPDHMQSVPAPVPRPDDLAIAAPEPEEEPAAQPAGQPDEALAQTDAPPPASDDGENTESAAPTASAETDETDEELPELNPSVLSQTAPAAAADDSDGADEADQPDAPAANDAAEESAAETQSVETVERQPVPTQMATVPLPARRPAR